MNLLYVVECVTIFPIMDFHVNERLPSGLEIAHGAVSFAPVLNMAYERS